MTDINIYFRKTIDSFTTEELKQMFLAIRDELGLVTLNSVSKKSGIDYKKLRGTADVIEVGDKKFVPTEKVMTEAQIQKECFMWFHNKYPHLRGLFFRIKNEENNAVAGARNKAIGFAPGAANSFLLVPRVGPVFVKFKTEAGKLSKEQKKWQGIIEAAGFQYELISSLSEFQSLCIELEL